MQVKLGARPGVSLVEIVIALALAAVLGATATGAFVTQSRFFDVQEKVALSRGMSRGALNMMVTELRMIEQDNGIESASTRHLSVRAPYALAVACGILNSKLIYAQLPADPSMLADAKYSGLAFRTRSTGRYTYVEETNTRPTPFQSGASFCMGAGITPYADGGRVMRGNLPDDPSQVPEVGAPVFLYQRVTYEFKSSVKVPGRIALWRRAEQAGDDGEEIAAPFDPSAGFRFYVNDAKAATSTVPAVLSNITGIELRLDGLSERPERNGSHRTVPLSSSVFFKNRLSS